ncbi:MAG: O-antigen ligase family protein [Syntrophaceae bacterium]|nr:O-antigen ligase family protein [Syntrophaceae bacterium]
MVFKMKTNMEAAAFKNEPGLIVGIPHVAWILSFLSLFSIMMKSGQGIVVMSAANAFRIGTLSLACAIAVFFILFRRRGFVRLTTGPTLLLLIYAAIGIISGVYATEPFYALWKAMEVLTDVLILGAVLSYEDSRRSANGLYVVALITFIVLLFSVLAGVVIAPGEAITEARGTLPIQIRGLLPPINANGVAFLAAFVGLASIVRCLRYGSKRRRLSWLCVSSIAVVILIFAQSRTSFVGFLVSLVVFLWANKRKKLLLVLIALIVIIMSFAMIRDIVTGYVQRGQSMELAMKLSGRTRAWKAAWNLISESPYLGKGFASAARFDVLKGGHVSTLHGSIFDVLAGVGMLGFIPWIGAITLTTFRVYRPRGWNPRRPRGSGNLSIYAEMLAVMTLILIRAITSSGLALHDHTFMLFIAMVAVASSSEKDLSAVSPHPTRKFARQWTKSTVI